MSESFIVPHRSRVWPDATILVDEADAERVMLHRWTPYRPGPRGDRVILYAHAGINGRNVLLHRFILGLADPSIKVDHENHDGLDCRRSNLRTGTQQQNIYNRRGNLHSSSQYKGVHWCNQKGRWRVRLRHNGKTYSFGRFDDEEEAALVYDEKAKELFGDRAYLNFPAH